MEHPMPESQLFSIDKPAQFERLAHAVGAIAPHRLPLVHAAQLGLINVIEPGRCGVIPKRMLEDTRRPVIVLIGDDDYQSTGPAGWRCAARVRRWGRGAMVHAAGGRPEHYFLAVQAALTTQRIIIAETDSAHEAEWADFFRPHMGVCIIRAPEDSPHPKMPARGDLN
jgi:hypothetical protein